MALQALPRLRLRRGEAQPATLRFGATYSLQMQGPKTDRGMESGSFSKSLLYLSHESPLAKPGLNSELNREIILITHTSECFLGGWFYFALFLPKFFCYTKIGPYFMEKLWINSRNIFKEKYTNSAGTFVQMRDRFRETK